MVAVKNWMNLGLLRKKNHKQKEHNIKGVKLKGEKQKHVGYKVWRYKR